VEGSVKHGGIQPNYLVSLKDPGLRPLLRQANRIGQRRDLSYWEKVETVRSAVSKALPNGEYTNPVYRGLLSKYRGHGKPLPLGAYVKRKVGVCREHYLLLHLALNQAGIDNQAVYAKVKQGSGRDAQIEDHGFVVLRGGLGDGWTVDSYNANFNGVRFSELQRKRGVGASARLAPIGVKTEIHRSILRINPYPSFQPAPVGLLSQLKRAFGN